MTALGCPGSSWLIPGYAENRHNWKFNKTKAKPCSNWLPEDQMASLPFEITEKTTSGTGTHIRTINLFSWILPFCVVMLLLWLWLVGLWIHSAHGLRPFRLEWDATSRKKKKKKKVGLTMRGKNYGVHLRPSLLIEVKNYFWVSVECSRNVL